MKLSHGSPRESPLCQQLGLSFLEFPGTVSGARKDEMGCFPLTILLVLFFAVVIKMDVFVAFHFLRHGHV